MTLQNFHFASLLFSQSHYWARHKPRYWSKLYAIAAKAEIACENPCNHSAGMAFSSKHWIFTQTKGLFRTGVLWRKKSIDTAETFTMEHIAALFNGIVRNGLDFITLNGTHTLLK